MYVTNQIPLADKLLHLTINDNSTETQITALRLKSDDIVNRISSDHLLHFTVVGSNCTTNEINLSNDYTSIEYLNEKFDKLIAVPLKKTEYEIITLTKDNGFQIESAIQTPHLLKYFQIQVYSTFFVTFGIDGLVNVWDSNTFQVITSFFPHNKVFGGVRRCVADASRRFLCNHGCKHIFYLNIFCRYFLTLGSSTNLMCTELSTKFHKLIDASLQSDAVASDLNKSIAIDLSPKSEGMYETP